MRKRIISVLILGIFFTPFIIFAQSGFGGYDPNNPPAGYDPDCWATTFSNGVGTDVRTGQIVDYHCRVMTDNTTVKFPNDWYAWTDQQWQMMFADAKTNPLIKGSVTATTFAWAEQAYNQAGKDAAAALMKYNLTVAMAVSGTWPGGPNYKPPATLTNCENGDTFSALTGLPCTNNTPVPSAPSIPTTTTTTTSTTTVLPNCAPGDTFSALTGMPCPTQTTSTPKVTASALPVGCATLSGFSSVSGLPCSGSTTYTTSNPTVTTSSSQAITLTASPTSVSSGQQATISWKTSGFTSCSSIDFYVPRGGAASGSATVYPTKTTTFWMSCLKSTGTEEKSVTVYVGSGGPTYTGYTPPTTTIPTTTTTTTSTPISSPTNTGISSSKFSIGDQVSTLTTLNVRSSASVNSSILSRQYAGAMGSIVGGPIYSDGYYWWQVNYASGVSGWSAENYLEKTGSSGLLYKPGVSFSASPSVIPPGGSSVLTWSSVYADSCSGDISGNKMSGSVTVTPTQTTSYSITCSSNNTNLNPNDRADTKVVTVNVTDPSGLFLAFSGGHAYLNNYGTYSLNWSTSNATSCVASGDWSGDKATSGSITFNPTSSTAVYTLTCSNTSAQTTKSVYYNASERL